MVGDEGRCEQQKLFEGPNEQPQKGRGLTEAWFPGSSQLGHCHIERQVFGKGSFMLKDEGIITLGQMGPWHGRVKGT